MQLSKKTQDVGPVLFHATEKVASIHVFHIFQDFSLKNHFLSKPFEVKTKKQHFFAKNNLWFNPRNHLFYFSAEGSWLVAKKDKKSCILFICFFVFHA